MNCLTPFIDSALVISSSTDTLQRDRQTGRGDWRRERGGGGGGEGDRQTDRQSQMKHNADARQLSIFKTNISLHLFVSHIRHAQQHCNTKKSYTITKVKDIFNSEWNLTTTLILSIMGTNRSTAQHHDTHPPTPPKKA